jgi:hypothetical protein
VGAQAGIDLRTDRHSVGSSSSVGIVAHGSSGTDHATRSAGSRIARPLAWAPKSTRDISSTMNRPTHRDLDGHQIPKSLLLLMSMRVRGEPDSG